MKSRSRARAKKMEWLIAVKMEESVALFAFPSRIQRDSFKKEIPAPYEIAFGRFMPEKKPKKRLTRKRKQIKQKRK